MELPNTSQGNEDTNDRARSKFLSRFSGFNLSKDAFLYYEVLFRQLMASEQARTGFRYENEILCIEDFCGKMSPSNRVDKIKAYLAKHPNRSDFGFSQLTFEKKSTVRKIEIDVKRAMKDLEFFEATARKSMEESESKLIDLTDPLKDLRDKVLKNLKKDLAKETKSSGFLTLSKDGVLSINITRFEFLRHYAQLYSGLLEAHFALASEDFEEKESEESEQKNHRVAYGIQTFIAEKLNFEFGNRLGMKLGAHHIRPKLDMRLKNSLELLPSKIKIIDADFVNHLFLRHGAGK